ncbi:hypothetical protein [Rhodococcus pyridinivorans]|uniref:hypothetical protein n=1 Tax=Rhodococcus pyridinivorans TaxID=103816 RepID=UPI0020791A65|nr:hypothetical protein [Rhodococcus pyridinivorans]USI93110.1 hypothetical protein LLA01_24865 [Rhodococcus pyridinivorans]
MAMKAYSAEFKADAVALYLSDPSHTFDGTGEPGQRPHLDIPRESDVKQLPVEPGLDHRAMRRDRPRVRRAAGTTTDV